MKWSKEKPTEPGWYWTKSIGTLDEIVLVVRMIDGRIGYKLIGLKDCLDINDEIFAGDEWYGPIQPPGGE